MNTHILQLSVEKHYSNWSKYDELYDRVVEHFKDRSKEELLAIHACIWEGFTPISNILGVLDQKLDLELMEIYELLVQLAKEQVLLITVNGIVYIEPNFQVFLDKTTQRVLHVPPMIHPPKEVKYNEDSAYLSISENKLILGSKLNKHDLDICLDFINLKNQTGYVLDTYVLMNTEPAMPEWEALTREERFKEEQYWERYCEETKELCEFIGDKTIYFAHGVDLRGRLYSKGYHLNPQGTDWRKAVLSFEESETVIGEL